METIFTSILVLVVIFFLLREVMCWYYKINDIIKLQETHVLIQRNTVMLLEKLVNLNTISSNAVSKATNGSSEIIASATSQEILTKKAAPVINISKEASVQKESIQIINYSPVPDIMDKLTVDEKNEVFSKSKHSGCHVLQGLV